MKLIRFGELGKEKPGIHIEGTNYDVSAFIEDYNESFFAGEGLLQLQDIVDKHKKAYLLLLAIQGSEARSPAPLKLFVLV